MRRNRKAKTTVIFIASIIALAMTGATYALWYEDLYIWTDVHTGEVDWEFWHTNWYLEPGDPEQPHFGHDDHDIDPGKTKDVGSNWAEFFDTDGDGDFDTMHLVLENVYPGYYDHLVYQVHCNGNIPIHVWRVQFTDLDGNIIPFTLLDGTVLDAMYTTQDELAFLDISGPDGVPDGEFDLFIPWGNNFDAQMHYCDYLDMSFSIHVLQPCPQGAHLEFYIKQTAVQYNEHVYGPIDGY
jgi:hypothetical protein